MIRFRAFDLRTKEEIQKVQGFRVIKKIERDNGPAYQIDRIQIYYGPDDKTIFTKLKPEEVKLELQISGHYVTAIGDDFITGMIIEGDCITIDFRNGPKKFYLAHEISQLPEGQKAIGVNQNLATP